MRVLYRYTLMLLLICSTIVLSAQTDKKDPVDNNGLRVKYKQVENGRFVLGKPMRTVNFSSNLWTSGAYLVTTKAKDSISNVKMTRIGKSDFIKTNGPVETGNSIEVWGKDLQANSVNIDIVDTEGRTISYKETEVAFDEEHKKLTISTSLKPGIYTLHIPVPDGIAIKTVIVQKEGDYSWRNKKH